MREKREGCFNPLHRGIGLLTLTPYSEPVPRGWFQSSSSRHRSSDETQKNSCVITVSFNPLHRGIGLLTVTSIQPVPAVLLFQSSSSRHRSSDSAGLTSSRPVQSCF